jgi:tetratricopeptide (TPR) repeat protein
MVREFESSRTDSPSYHAFCRILLWFFRERTFFLGDGYLCLRNLPSASAVGEAAFAFKRTPFVGFILFQVYRLFDFFGSVTPAESAYRWMSIIAGIGCVAAAWVVIRLFSKDRSEQVLLLLLFVSSGASEIFFGYVENYALAFPCILLFLYLSVAYLRENVSIAWPVIFFGIVVTLHFGGLSFIPALILLIFLAWQRKQRAELAASLFLMCTIVYAILQICGYTPRLFQSVFWGGRSYTLPFTGILEKNQAYHLFSWNHFVDLVNFLLLVIPGSLAVFILSAVVFWKKSKPITRELWFLLLSAACGLLFLFFVNCELGMSRDWDLLVPFQAGVFAAAAAMWMSATEESMLRQRVLVTIGLAALLQSTPFIGVNASQERSIARFHQLQDSALWSTHAKLDAYEVLAIYHRERKDFFQAIQYYSDYVALDSSNHRLWWNLAATHLEAGNSRKALNVYKTMIRLGMGDANVWSGLGVLFAEQLDPVSPLIQCNVGAMIVESEKNYSKALSNFLAAIRIDSMFSGAYTNAAICYAALGDSNKANQYRMFSKKYSALSLQHTGP